MALPKTTIYLRSGGQDLALALGNYVIGRSPLCNLVIDGPLVSRRHAELRVAGETAIIKDLDSVNGVLVNGQRIFGTRVLKPGDKLRIGHRELELVVGAIRIDQTIEISEATRGHRSLGTGSEDEREANVSFSGGRAHSDSTRQAGALELVGQVAERALADGRMGEAEMLLANHLKRVLTSLQSGVKVDGNTCKKAVDFGLRLAEGTGNAAWFSFSLQLLRAMSALCTEELAAQLRRALLRIPNADPDQLSSYARGVRNDFPFNLDHLASAQRLEELAQLARGRARVSHPPA